MSTFTPRALSGSQEVSDITVDDNLTCNSGYFTSLGASTASITNMTVTSLITSNIKSPNITGGTSFITSMTVSAMYSTNTLVIPCLPVTGTTGSGSMYFSLLDNKLHVYGNSGWVSSQFS